MTKKTKHREINTIVRKIVREFKPEKIILFGSYAWGNPGQDSDVDLCIIKKTASPVKLEERIDIALAGRTTALDLLVYTPNQLTKSLRNGNPFMRDIIENGKHLYEKG